MRVVANKAEERETVCVSERERERDAQLCWISLERFITTKVNFSSERFEFESSALGPS